MIETIIPFTGLGWLFIGYLIVHKDMMKNDDPVVLIMMILWPLYLYWNWKYPDIMNDQVPQVIAIRKCIRCNDPFKSKSSAHRVCGKCRQDYNKVSQRHIHITPVPVEREK